MRRKTLYYGLVGFTFFLIALGQSNKTIAANKSILCQQAVAGLPLALNTYYETTEVENPENIDKNTKTIELDSFLTKEEKEAQIQKAIADAKKYENIGIAKVDRYLNIRNKPDTKGKVIGKLPNNGGCYIYSIDENGWAKIKSGSIKGYVSAEYLIAGQEIPTLAKKVGRLVATVNEGPSRVRVDTNTECKTLTSVPKGSELEIKDNSDNTWVKVEVDNEIGYIHRDLVTVSYQLRKAIAYSESTGSSVRAKMVAYAKQFLGNRYVFGGTSLSRGIDCSAFTMKIYQRFGYNISRTSRTQAAKGRKISVYDLKPGDLVFYANNGYIFHVAMYIGGGQVIHASSPSTGIIISNLSYRSICKAVRFIND